MSVIRTNVYGIFTVYNTGEHKKLSDRIPDNFWTARWKTPVLSDIVAKKQNRYWNEVIVNFSMKRGHEVTW